MPKYKRKVYFPMNKTEFIAKVAAKAGVEKKTAAALVDAALEVATDAMRNTNLSASLASAHCPLPTGRNAPVRIPRPGRR